LWYLLFAIAPVTFISHHTQEVNTKNPYGETALHTACICGQRKIVDFLLSDPCTDINACDSVNNTPFILAAMNGHLGVVEMLHECGLREGKEININARNKYENTGIFGYFLCTYE
jgi:ankyrin repeat protein